MTSEAQWQRFCDVLGRPAWTDDERFAGMPSRVKHRELLDGSVAAWTREREPHTIMEMLQKAGVPAGAVQDGRDLVNDPHLRARGMLVQVPHPVVPPLTFPGIPIRLSKTPARIVRHAPLLGQDNDYVFHDLLGMSDGEIAELTRQEVLV